MSTQPDHVDRIQDQWRRERPDLDPSPAGVIGRLHRVARALTDELTPVFDEHGLSEGEFDVLCALRRTGHPYRSRPADLARTTMITTGGLTKRLDRLERAGLVQRSSSEQGDARAKTVTLTAEGETLIDRAYTAHLANEHRLVAALSPRDRAHLERILRHWLGVLEPDVPEDASSGIGRQ